MAQHVFIKVVGFSDDERHALEEWFRLSEQCRTTYRLWPHESDVPPALALLDAQSHEAGVEAESALQRGLRIAWVGNHPPAQAWRSFPSLASWPEVMEALDTLFASDRSVDIEIGLDLDLELGDATAPAASQKQALIVSASREQRLYLRARLALARLTLADEADSATQAVELARDKQYDIALVDGSLPDMNGWSLLRQLRTGRHPIRRVAMSQGARSVPQRVRAWMAGVDALLGEPPDPQRLGAWLSRV